MFQNPPLKLSSPDKDDKLFLAVDSLRMQERSVVRCTINSSGVLRVRFADASTSWELDSEQRLKLAHQAVRDQMPLQPVEALHQREGSSSKLECWAVVDVACRRVFAVKLVLSRTDCDSKAAGYVLVPAFKPAQDTQATSTTVADIPRLQPPSKLV